ncbi:uncharacterized protein RJT20DRAFT_270 [Scheffersomyces xylosifermentans]|uniref:uncharacterized protein n=1 Tax=Scheffersomyces xylosifermentans TaxID=1304137 RepID=UPI00315D0884
MYTSTGHSPVLSDYTEISSHPPYLGLDSFVNEPLAENAKFGFGIQTPVEIPEASKSNRANAIFNRNPSNKVSNHQKVSGYLQQSYEKVIISQTLTQPQKESIIELILQVRTLIDELVEPSKPSKQPEDAEITPGITVKVLSVIKCIDRLTEETTETPKFQLNQSGAGKYGIFQDSISTLSPSNSSRSYFEDQTPGPKPIHSFIRTKPGQSSRSNQDHDSDSEFDDEDNDSQTIKNSDIRARLKHVRKPFAPENTQPNKVRQVNHRASMITPNRISIFNPMG